MGNPPLLMCDSDAVIQFLLTNEFRPFHTLREDYGVQPAIVEEVEIEICSLRKFRDRCAPELKKAISKDLLRILDYATLSQIIPHGSAVMATNSAIQTTGKIYFLRVGRGEAFTHAAAVTLGVPSLSNDGNAIYVLRNAGLTLPSPVLRAFDLVALCYDTGIMSEKDCDKFRALLLGSGESIPNEFKNKSFADGLVNFGQRLLDSSAGVSTTSQRTHKSPLVLVRKTPIIP